MYISDCFKAFEMLLLEFCSRLAKLLDGWSNCVQFCPPSAPQVACMHTSTNQISAPHPKTNPERVIRQKMKTRKRKSYRTTPNEESPYFLWINENIEKIQKNQPGLALTQLSEKPGEIWKYICTKLAWIAKAKEDNERNDKELKKWTAKFGKEGPSTAKENVRKTKNAPVRIKLKRNLISARLWAVHLRVPSRNSSTPHLVIEMPRPLLT